MKLLPFYASILTYIFSYIVCGIIGHFLGSHGFDFIWVFPPALIQLGFFFIRRKVKKLNFFAMSSQTIYAIFFIFYMIPDLYKLEAYLAFFISLSLLCVTILKLEEFLVISLTGIIFFFWLYIFKDGVVSTSEIRITFILLSFSFFSFLSSIYVNWIRLRLKKKEKTLQDNLFFITNQKSNLNNILNNLNQGYLTFDKFGTIGDEVTMITNSLLENDIKKVRDQDYKVWDLIYEDEKKKEQFKSWVCKVFDGKLSFKDLLPLAPKYFKGKKYKDVKLDFRPIFYEKMNKKVEKIIMISIDKTNEVLLEAEAERKNGQVNFIINCLDHPIDFLDLIHDTYEALDKDPDLKNEKELLFRKYHTLKARFGQFKLISLVKKIDKIENYIQNSDEKKLKISIQEFKDDFDSLLKENSLIVKAANKFMVEDGQAIEAYRVIEYIVNAESLEELHLLIYEDHILVDLKRKLKRYIELTKQIGLDQEKEIVLEITGDDVLVEYNKYSEFVNSLIHIFRNMIDHGIETKDERDKNNKNLIAKIDVKFKKYKDKFVITLKDDGRGMDPEKIKSTAISRGLKTEKEINKLKKEEIFNLVFLQGFSTKEGVSELSGRGVGMGAVQSEINNLSGSITIDSEIGKETKFIVTLPLK